jgi:ankyrin repeat protein
LDIFGIYGRLNIAKIFIDNIYINTEFFDNIQTDYYNILTIACKYGKIDLLDYLLNHPKISDKDILFFNENNESIVDIVFSFGKIDLIKYIINSPKIPEDLYRVQYFTYNYMKNPLFSIIKNPNLDSIDYILKSTKITIENVNYIERNIYKDNIITYIVKNIHEYINKLGLLKLVLNSIRFTIEDIAHRDKYGDNILDYLCGTNYLELIKYLFEEYKHIDLLISDKILHFVAEESRYGNFDILCYLLKSPKITDKHINYLNKYDNTIFMQACKDDSIELALFLLGTLDSKYIHYKNNYNESAFSLCLFENHEMAIILYNYKQKNIINYEYISKYEKILKKYNETDECIICYENCNKTKNICKKCYAIYCEICTNVIKECSICRVKK